MTLENRVAKAAEYYSKALEYYALAEDKLRGEGRFDALTNVYFNMGWSSFRIGDSVKACGYYDRALDAYSENIVSNPGAKPHSPSGSVPEFLESQKQQVGCS